MDIRHLERAQLLLLGRRLRCARALLPSRRRGKDGYIAADARPSASSPAAAGHLSLSLAAANLRPREGNQRLTGETYCWKESEDDLIIAPDFRLAGGRRCVLYDFGSSMRCDLGKD